MAIYITVECEDGPVVQLRIEKSADRSAKDGNGDTRLH
jgi:hypothetical protein